MKTQFAIQGIARLHDRTVELTGSLGGPGWEPGRERVSSNNRHLHDVKVRLSILFICFLLFACAALDAFGSLSKQIPVFLDGRPMPVTGVTNYNATWPYQWQASLDLSPGAHQLQTEVVHPRPGLGNATVMYRFPGNVNAANGMFEIDVRSSVSGNTEVIMHLFF